MTNLLNLLNPQPTATRQVSGGPLDRRLLDHLIRQGHLTESGLTRRARIRTCDCRQPVLVGLDDDVCALDAITDPVPLTPLGEALARIEGRWTWSLRRSGHGFVLDRRDPLEILGRPAGTQTRTDVLRQHRCDTRDLADPETTTTSFAEIRAPRLRPGSPAPF